MPKIFNYSSLFVTIIYVFSFMLITTPSPWTASSNNIFGDSFPELLENETLQLSVLRGGNVTLPCVINTEDYEEVRWTRVDKSKVVPLNLTRNNIIVKLTETRFSVNDNGNESFLYISNVEDADRGQYTCSVLTDNQLLTVATIDLEVFVPVTLTNEEGYAVRPDEGTSVNLSCSVTSGYPEPRITWTRESGGALPIHRNFTNDTSGEIFEWEGHLLPLGDVNRNHTDVYECFARNSVNSKILKVELLVRFIPSVSVDVTSINASVGSDVMMRCVVHGYPLNFLTWRIQGQSRYENKQIGYNYLGNAEFETILKIDGIHRDDFTNFSCLAGNDLGRKNATVRILESGKIEDQSSEPIFRGEIQDMIFQKQGENVTFTCTVKHLGTDQIQWLNESSDVLFLGTTRRSGVSDRFTVSQDGDKWSLHIFNVQVEDRGRYSCEVNMKEWWKQTGRLEVIAPVQITPAEDVVVLEGMQIDLFCNATGFPYPTVTWEKALTVSAMSLNKVSVMTWDTRYLEFQAATREDAGAYRCKATNGEHNLTYAAEDVIYVFVLFEPSVEALESIVGVTLGTLVTLKCSVSAIPTPRIYWDADGRLIASNPRFVQNVTSFEEGRFVATLIISKVRTEDLQTYRCIAHNSVGTGTADVELVSRASYFKFGSYDLMKLFPLWALLETFIFYDLLKM